MAASRDQRRNAGNRMSRVLDEELGEDDFYKTTYGGFGEEEVDNDFHSDQEESADEVDSDFDRSENDELVSDDDETKPKRKRKGVSTKAYKEPVVKKPTLKKPSEPKPKSMEVNEQPKEKDSVDLKRPADQAAEGPSRKSSRKATATNSLMTNLRQKERKEIDKKKKDVPKKAVTGIRRLTQEELLAEAEKTERKNLKSLENFQKLEASRKKTMVKKRHFDVPTIKFFSTSMPNTNRRDDTVDVEGDPSSKSTANETTFVSRNFLVFSDETVLEDCFNQKKSRPPPKMLCPVTKKLARYVDPLTKIPYYDMYAFKQIREAYNLTIKDLKERNNLK